MPRRSAEADIQMSRKDFAEFCGLTVETLDKYRQRGTLPDEDGRLGGSPWWYRSTVEHWDATRPRRGYSPETHTPKESGHARRPATARAARTTEPRQRRHDVDPAPDQGARRRQARAS